MALSGDTALVGASGKSVGGRPDAGAAYVFTGSGASWSQQAEMSDPDALPTDEFGCAVALVGGHGAGRRCGRDRRRPQRDAGAAYVFTGSGASWSQQAEMTASDAAENDYSGYSVALCSGTALVGAPHFSSNSAGAAYVFTVAALITPELTLKLSGLTRGALKLGKRLTAKGSVSPLSLAGSKVTLTVQRRAGGKWRKVTSLTRAISASGAYSWKYKPAKKGSYRMKATIARTAAHTAATTTWRTFKVK